MHPEALAFTLYVRQLFASYFDSKVVLDVGSGDINGNNRELFTNCEYHGNDVIEAPNVTIVSKTMDLPFPDEHFDTIISTECFEHDPTYRESLQKIYRMLKPGGLFAFTCASIGRPEHGTRRSSADASYGTIGQLPDMQDYYMNLSIRHVKEVYNLDNDFAYWNAYYHMDAKDLYFVGIKAGTTIEGRVPIYNVPRLIIHRF